MIAPGCSSSFKAAHSQCCGRCFNGDEVHQALDTLMSYFLLHKLPCPKFWTFHIPQSTVCARTVCLVQFTTIENYLTLLFLLGARNQCIFFWSRIDILFSRSNELLLFLHHRNDRNKTTEIKSTNTVLKKTDFVLIFH